MVGSRAADDDARHDLPRRASAHAHDQSPRRRPKRRADPDLTVALRDGEGQERVDARGREQQHAGRQQRGHPRGRPHRGARIVEAIGEEGDVCQLQCRIDFRPDVAEAVDECRRHVAGKPR